MSDFNKVIMMGRLTAKPELRFTPGGTAVATLRLACSKKFKSKAGDEKEETCFIDVSVWDKQAETCAEYLVKGQRILVEGSINMRQWETANKEKRITYDIRAQSVRFLEKPRGASAASGDESAPPVSDSDVPASGLEDEDIPF
ncbi:MAG: single-stranded DNA-binding protein [Candidatus Hydrogenedentota bacterium]